MFTGIITDIGRVRAIEARGERRLAIETSYPVADIAVGASIACSGVCLTVVETGAAAAGWFAADVSAETLAKTTLGDWRVGTPVNLERALGLGAELGGHLVSGHVDGVAEIAELRRDGGSRRVTLRAAAALAPFIAPKGSIALDGVSLTVNEVADEADGGCRFGINIVPHTAAQTTFGQLRPGARVNLEIDMLARYLRRFLEKRA